MNKRSILADIGIQDGAYEGKKVTRAELEGDQDSEGSNQDIEDYGDESGELEEVEEDGESAMSASSSDSVPFDAKALRRNQDEEEDADKQHKKELLKKLEGDAEATDEELDAALDLVIKDKKEESKLTQVRQASDLEKAEAVQTQRKVFNTVLQ